MLAGFFVGRGLSYNLSNCKPADAACKGKACLPYNLSVCFADSSPSRGALGIAVQFVLLAAAAWHTARTKHSGTPEAPLLGELDAVRRPERLYRDETYLLKRKAPFKDEKLKKI